MLGPYQNPFAGAIADALAQPFNARANALRASGDAWAQGLNTVSHAAMQTIGDFLRYKEGAPRRELEAEHLKSAKIDVQDKQRARDFQSALREVMRDTPHADEQGVAVYDVTAISKTLTDRGFGAETDQVVKHLGSINEAFRGERTAKLAVVREGAQALIRAGNDPLMAGQFIGLLERNQTISAETAKSYRDAIEDDPENVAKITAYYGGPHKYGTAAPGTEILDETTGQLTGQRVPDRHVAPTAASLAADAANPSSPTRAASQAALDLMRRNTSIDQQAADALAKGDTETYARLLKVKKDMGQADNVPRVVNRTWVTRGGQPTFVPETDVKPGDTPYTHPAADSALNPGGKAVAERWKHDQLAALEKAFKEPGPGRMTPEQLEAAKLQVENSYRSQIGLSPLTELPKTWQSGAPKPTPSPAAAPPKATPTPTPTPKPSATPAPKPAAAGEVPPAVQNVLKTQKAGVYTLSDGTKWQKAADGTITPVR